MGWTRDAEGVEPAALASVADFRGRRVLEVGCGDGRLTWSHAAVAAAVLAVDPSEEAIAEARAATPPELDGRVRFEVAAGEDLDLPSGSFDIALLPWSL